MVRPTAVPDTLRTTPRSPRRAAAATLSPHARSQAFVTTGRARVLPSSILMRHPTGPTGAPESPSDCTPSAPILATTRPPLAAISRVSVFDSPPASSGWPHMASRIRRRSARSPAARRATSVAAATAGRTTTGTPQPSMPSHRSGRSVPSRSSIPRAMVRCTGWSRRSYPANGAPSWRAKSSMPACLPEHWLCNAVGAPPDSSSRRRALGPMGRWAPHTRSTDVAPARAKRPATRSTCRGSPP